MATILLDIKKETLTGNKIKYQLCLPFPAEPLTLRRLLLDTLPTNELFSCDIEKRSYQLFSDISVVDFERIILVKGEDQVLKVQKKTTVPIAKGLMLFNLKHWDSTDIVDAHDEYVIDLTSVATKLTVWLDGVNCSVRMNIFLTPIQFLQELQTMVQYQTVSISIDTHVLYHNGLQIPLHAETPIYYCGVREHDIVFVVVKSRMLYQITCNRLPNSSVIMTVNPNFPVRLLSQMVDPTSNTVKCRGEYLDQLKTLSFLNLVNETLVFEHVENYRLVVKTLTGKTLTPHVYDKNTTVLDIMKQVQDCEGIPISQQTLTCSFRVLPPEANLVDYSISPGSVLHLILRLRGGMYHHSSSHVGLQEDLPKKMYGDVHPVFYYKYWDGKASKFIEFKLSLKQCTVEAISRRVVKIEHELQEERSLTDEIEKKERRLADLMSKSGNNNVIF